ncbi:MAG: hypothetical protein IIV81_02660 [Clostridia bacterium]|nr:hypothetical protein [Clostridia bacterium]
MNKIKIGWSEQSIVPEGRKVDLVGQFYERISDVVETPISITALAIECGDDAAIFCVCDLVSTSHALLREIREAIPEGLGIPKDKIMLSVIHTHTSMGYSGRGDGFGSSLQCLMKIKPEHIEYVPLVSDNDPNILRGDEAKAFIIERAVKAIVEAWEKRSEGGYATGFGRAAIGMCRRVCYDDGSAKMWGDTNKANFTELETGNDGGIEMLFTYDTKGKLTGVIANIACPSQVLEHQNFISSDLSGKIKGLVREKYGNDVNFIYFISPAGDQCPRDMVRWVDAEIKLNDPNIIRDYIIERDADPSMFDVSGCERAALRAVNEIFYELDHVKNVVTETELEHKKLTVSLPVRRVTIEEKDAAVRELERFFEKCGDKIDYADNANNMIHAGTIARYEYQQEHNMYDIEVHVLRLGDIAFATNPFELFLNYGNQMRARSKARQTFLIQQCCGAFGYLPTEKAEKGSHYSAFVSSGTTGHVGGDILVRTTVEEINKMWKEEK